MPPGINGIKSFSNASSDPLRGNFARPDLIWRVVFEIDNSIEDLR